MEFSFTPAPRLDRLTPETLMAIDDGVIESSLVNYVLENSVSAEDELGSISSLPEALQAWYVAFVVDAEVLNGGFNQFFFNSSRELAPAAPAAFDRLGIPAAGALIRQALDLLALHAPAFAAAHDEETIEAFIETYLDQPFAELDERYAADEERWRIARIRFIRQQADAFRHP